MPCGIAIEPTGTHACPVVLGAIASSTVRVIPVLRVDRSGNGIVHLIEAASRIVGQILPRHPLIRVIPPSHRASRTRSIAPVRRDIGIPGASGGASLPQRLEYLLVGPWQALALTDDVQSFNLVHQVILNLIDPEPHLLVLCPQLLELAAVQLDVLHLLRDLLLVPLPLLLQFYARCRQLAADFLDVVRLA